MRQFPSSPAQLLRSLSENASLIRALATRDVLGRYRGSALGLTWSFLQPLIMLALYTFVFSGVFKARWGGAEDESTSAFAITLFAGLLAFNFFSETVNRAPGLILSNTNFVKKVVFPLEVLPVVSLCSAAFHLLVSLAVLVLAEWTLQGHVPWTAALFPVVVAPLMILALGCSWFLSALAVYVRDVGQITTMVTTILLFASAVFFPLSAISPEYRTLLALNPICMVVEQCRQVLVFGDVPSGGHVAALWLIALSTACVGFFWFQRTRRGFADVL